MTTITNKQGKVITGEETTTITNKRGKVFTGEEPTTITNQYGEVFGEKPTTITNQYGKVFTGEELKNLPISSALKKKAANLYGVIEMVFNSSSTPIPDDWESVHEYLTKKTGASEPILEYLKTLRQKFKSETGSDVESDVIFDIGKREKNKGGLRRGKTIRKPRKQHRKSRKQSKK